MENILGTNLIQTEITETEDNVNEVGLVGYRKVLEKQEYFYVSVHSVKTKISNTSVKRIMRMLEAVIEENVLFTFYHPDDYVDKVAESKTENLIDKTNLSSTNMTKQTGDDTFRSRTRTISKSKFSTLTKFS